MSRARAWWGSDHWQQFLIVATALMVALIFAGTLSVLLTGRATNRTVTLQQANQDRSVCTANIYSAWFQAVGDVIVTASEGDEPKPREVVALTDATDDLRRINVICAFPEE